MTASNAASLKRSRATPGVSSSAIGRHASPSRARRRQERGTRQHLKRMGRGQLLGEMSLFGGTRTADIDAETPVRVLRWTTDCLDRIQARHPKVAARLMRNLIEAMAPRSAELADRLA